MKILLSPAKSIDMNVEVPSSSFSSPYFRSEATQLSKKLALVSKHKLMKLMGISESLAEINVHRYRNFVLSDEQTEHVKPAAFIFTGEVYKGLDFATLSQKNQMYAQESLRILSGLYGVLRPFDLIYPYRLEMGTSWQITPKIKNVYTFWGDKVAKQLELEMHVDEVIVNLASNEYFKVLPKNSLKHRIITPVFKEFKGAKYSIVMMYAKHARGAMARYIVENQIEDVDQLKAYNVDRYRFHQELSSNDVWIFTR